MPPADSRSIMADTACAGVVERDPNTEPRAHGMSTCSVLLPRVKEHRQEPFGWCVPWPCRLNEM